MNKAVSSILSVFLSFMLVFSFVPWAWAAEGGIETDPGSGEKSYQEDPLGPEDQGLEGTQPPAENESTVDGSDPDVNQEETPEGGLDPDGDSDESEGVNDSTMEGEDDAVNEPQEEVVEDPESESGEVLPMSRVASPAELDKLAQANLGAVADGTYVIASAKASSAVLDIKSGSTANSANAQLYSSNDTDAQKWYVTHDAAGYLIFTNAKSGKVLDVASGKAVSRTNVQQYASNSSRAQKWIAIASGTSFRIVSALDSDLVLDAASGKTSNGTNVRIYKSNGTAAQKWQFKLTLSTADRQKSLDALAAKHRTVVADGTYIVASSKSSTAVLDVKSGSTANSANVQMYASNDTDAQKWRISHDEKGYLTIVNAKSGKALDVKSGKAANRSNVQQYTSNGTRAQKWIAVPDGGSFKLVSALDDRFVLDIASGKTANGTNVQVYESNGTAAQKWKFIVTTAAVDRLDVLAKDNKSVLADGTYTVRISSSASAVFDIKSGSTANSANAQLYTSNGTDAQKWKVSHDAKGYVTLINVKSGKVLDVASGKAANGANVQQYASNSSRAQKWVAVKAGSGFKLVSALDDSLVLDAAGGKAANGTNVQLYKWNNSAAQKWVFLAASCSQVVKSGFYGVRSSLNSSFVLDVASGSASDGANVQLYTSNKTKAQIFSLEYSRGYYTIKNIYSLKPFVMDSTSSNVYQKASTADTARWSIRKNSNGTYSIVNAATGLALAAASSTPANSVNVQGASLNASNKAQTWTFDGSVSSVVMESYNFSMESFVLMNGGSKSARLAIDPATYPYGTYNYLQFADLRGYTGLTGAQLNAYMKKVGGNALKGVLYNEGDAVVSAAKKNNINEMYLLAHMALETGWGTSNMAKGKTYKIGGTVTVTIDGQKVSKTYKAGTYYNFIGWGAYDTDPDKAFDWARYYGWNTKEAALSGAAQMLSRYYINAGQETLYKMRFDPDYTQLYNRKSSHQYCTSFTWAPEIGWIMGDGYAYSKATPTLIYRVPKYL